MPAQEDQDRWDAALARIVLSTRRTIADLAGELLRSEAGRSYVEGRLVDAELGDAAWRIAQFEVESIARAGSDEWVARAVAWLGAGDASWERSARFCSDVAWTARAAQNSVLLHLGSSDVPRDGIETAGDRARLHLILQSQRYDFRFTSIIESIRETGQPLADLDPFSRAIHVFALFGTRAPSATVEMDRLREIERNHEKVAHALLHGLWFADHLPDQAERMLGLIDETPALRLDDSTVALRRAHALRKLRRYEEATASIDLGILNLAPSAVDVHQDFARERAMIIVAREIENSYARERQALGADAERHMTAVTDLTSARILRIEDKISDSLRVIHDL